MELLKIIVTSPAVWAALLTLADAVLTVVYPDYPREVWGALKALIISLLAAAGIPVIQQRYEQSCAIKDGE